MVDPKPTDRFLVPFWGEVGKGLGRLWTVSLVVLVVSIVGFATAGWSPVQQVAAVFGALSAIVFVITSVIAIAGTVQRRP